MSIHDSGSSRSIGGEFEQPNTSEGEEQEFKVHLAGQPFVIAIIFFNVILIFCSKEFGYIFFCY